MACNVILMVGLGHGSWRLGDAGLVQEVTDLAVSYKLLTKSVGADEKALP